MDAADVIALYGAGLSTVIAAASAWEAWRGRARLSVSAKLMYSAGESAYGTPVLVERGDDVLQETVVVAFEVRNHGGTPTQVLGLVIESPGSEPNVLQSKEIATAGLPVVLEPGTTIGALLQKEHFDFLESCTFVGVVDGMGRRHGVAPEQGAELLNRCWQLPTRVAVYQRRDDPDKRVVAFQLADSAKLKKRHDDRRIGRRAHVIAQRSRPLMETLMNGEQPRAKPSGTDHD